MTSNLDAAGAIQKRIKLETVNLAWTDIPGKKSILFAPGRRPKLLVTARSYAAQLAIETGGAPLPLAIYLSLNMKSGLHMVRDLQCLDWFAHHCAGLSFDVAPKRGLSPTALRNALVALDGWLAGASQRDIGKTIFGERRVTDDWDNGVYAYKSRTRRLIKKGRELMQRDYLKLL